ncbi:hypothetical protein GQ54DRAFT_51742 [Martensiomyces pterosporus]|nr:hypothetical protein GQ54DRAFT_51742 [Martensiomyces pterosporus]
MAPAHFIVSLFGSTSFDGVSVSIYAFDELQSNNVMRLLSEENPYPRNLFLMPTIDCPKNSSTPAYVLRCFSKRGEVDVPPLTGFAAAHVLLNEARIKADTIIILEGSRKLEFPVTKGGQIQCCISLGPSLRQGVQGPQRVLMMDLFGIMRRGLDLEYIESCRTLVVYDSESEKQDLRNLAPKPTSFTQHTISQLRVSTVVVCVKDPKSGGIFARAFLPAFDYAETEMPVFATPYLDSHWDDKLAFNPYEVSWTIAGKACHIVKKRGSPQSILFTRTATVQASHI